MIRCTVRFYEELNFFLNGYPEKSDIECSFHVTRSVKDLIESFGVPHVEVDLILVNGKSVNFEYLVANGDRISVYPVFEGMDIGDVTRLRPKPLRQSAFVADVHLKTLARRLRMLGFDTKYGPEFSDPVLADISAREERILLSRDRQLLMRNKVSRGLYVRNTDPDRQAPEIVERLDLYRSIKPFSRCISCNAEISPMAKSDIVSRQQADGRESDPPSDVPPGVLAWCEEFYRCTGCGKVYWKGSHYQRMLEIIERIASDRNRSGLR